MSQALEIDRSAQQEVTALATGLHQRMRSCDGEVCLELLMLLADGERGVGALAKMLLLDMPAVSTRLATLKREGLVVCRAFGPRRYYMLSPAVRVARSGGQCQLVIQCSGGGEISIGMPEVLVERLRVRWERLGDSDLDRRPGEQIRVRQISVRAIAARARAAVNRARGGAKTSSGRENGGRARVAVGM
jgi:DNA-binding transcriptional ArsR family regulator